MEDTAMVVHIVFVHLFYFKACRVGGTTPKGGLF